jgi:FKBP-type peptidyl-prolyl cis-trans isomerase
MAGAVAAVAISALVAGCGQGSIAERTIAEQTSREQEAAQRYLQEKRGEEGVQATPSGLLYRVSQETSDPTLARPTAQSAVLAHYEGRLPDGTVFDSSFARGQPAQFPLTQVIPGWTEGLQLMRPGDEFIFYIPPELGYGAGGSPPAIPPNSPLEFRVQLLAFQNPDGTIVTAPGVASSGETP